MATPSVTPNPNGNPFDQPLSSELQDSQQRQVATVAASSNGNPFDEPLASEKAEAGHTNNAAYLKTVNTGPLAPAGQAEKAMGEGLTNAQQAKEGAKALGNAAFQTAGGMLPGLGEAGGAVGEVGTLIDNAGEPIVKAAVDHLANLTKIVQAAKTLGWTTFGIKEAHDIYKMVSGDKK